MSACEICGVSAELKCGGCKSVSYCGKAHQKQHWKKTHKSQCKCYKITSNAQFGRHVVATRDIKPNEVILREYPTIVGPKLVSEPICLGCHKTLGVHPFHECSRCRWPLCSVACEHEKAHATECNVLAAARLPCQITAGQKASAYCAIVPLRCLLLKTLNPKSYQTLMTLEDHLSEQINTPIYQVLKNNLVAFIRNILGLDQFDETTILRIASILDTNTFEIRPYQKGSKVRAVFAEAAMLSHDCVPNTRHVFDENMQIQIIATVNIPKDAIISLSYTQPLKCTLDRRTHLKLSKCFDCVCSRCTDPTECRTFCGAIMCFQCKVNKVVSTNPLDNAAPWCCTGCSHRIPARQIVLGNKSLQNEIDGLNKKSPREFEKFLLRYRDTLHERNTHVVQVKYALVQLYGNVAGFYLNELTDVALSRKIELCHELLDVADAFEPGASLLRGKLLLDLQEAITVQAKREFNGELITKDSVQEKLIESMTILEEAVSILKSDPEMNKLLEERVRCLGNEIN